MAGEALLSNILLYFDFRARSFDLEGSVMQAPDVDVVMTPILAEGDVMWISDVDVVKTPILATQSDINEYSSSLSLLVNLY